MLKRLAIVALLCVPFVSAKGYTFNLGNKIQVGTAKLNPGEYSVSVKGSEAVITDESGHQTKAPMKIEAADSIFSETSVVMSNTNGVERIDYIGLKGTKDKVVLGQ